jgi:hypothetical protein
VGYVVYEVMNPSASAFPIAASTTPSHGSGRIWAARVLAALPVLALVSSAVIKLLHPAWVVEQWVGKMALPEDTMTALGLLELTCAALFVVPRTAVLGAILVTGYLGGAVSLHLRAGDPLWRLVDPAFFGVLAWGSLFLRDPRLKALLPLVKPR